MQNPKILLLLIMLVVFINYNNYILPNRDKQYSHLIYLNQKIEKEKKLNIQKIDPKKLQLPYDSMFFDGKKLNYSQAMGKLQNLINKNAKGLCKIIHLKWAQAPLSKDIYIPLRINASFECHPKMFYKFLNKLRTKPYLIITKNTKIFKLKRKNTLNINVQFIAYRKNDVNK